MTNRSQFLMSLAPSEAPSLPIVGRAGAAAVVAAEEFFYGRLSNGHTRAAYRRALTRFLAWCADLPRQLSPHSFRAALIMDLPGQGPGDANPRMTRLYAARQQATSNIGERIST